MDDVLLMDALEPFQQLNHNLDSFIQFKGSSSNLHLVAIQIAVIAIFHDDENEVIC